MIDILDQIKKAESMGIVGDSQEVRNELVERIHQGLISHEKSLKELAKIKKQARKEGLLIRADLTKNKLWDFDVIRKKIIHRRYQHLENKIPEKISEKKTINKI